MHSSVQYRNQGNRKFRASQKKSNNLSINEQYDMLLEAEKLFTQAHAVGQNNDEIASASKNLGICELKLSEYELQDSCQFSRRLRTAQNVLIEAYKSGVIAFKDQEWLLNTLQYIFQVGQSIAKLGKSEQDALFFEGVHFKKLFSEIKFDSFQLKSAVVDALMKYIQKGIEYAQELLEMQQDIQSKSILKELEWFLNEMNVLAPCSSEQKEELIKRQLDLLCIIDSHIARKKGDEILSKILHIQQENLQNFEYQAGLAEQYFQEARNLSKGRCLLAEGNAYSCLGVLYWKLLKKQQQAQKTLQACINLGYNAQQQCFVERQSWYINAKAILKELQTQQSRKNQEEFQKRRATFFETSPQIQQLQNAAKQDLLYFIQYIFQNHPPQNGLPEIQLENIQNNNQKRKILLQAMRSYHPDKQHGRQEQDRFIFEEISKFLSQKKDSLKL